MTSAAQRTFYLVFALLFALGMHYYQYNYGGGGLTAPFNLMTWSFVSVLIGLSLWHCSTSNTLLYSNFLILVAIFVGSLFLPMLYSNNDLLFNSAQRFIALTAGLVFLFSLYQINLPIEKWYKLITWVQVGVIIEGGICLTQQYVFSDTVWMQHNPNLRPTGIFQQPNVFSTFAVMGLALSAYVLAFNPRISKLEQGIIHLAGLMSGWIIVLNTSRTATIALFIVLLTTAPLLFRDAKKTHIQHWYLALLLGLTIPVLLNLLNPGFKSREIVETIRPTLYLVSLGLIERNSLTGVGYGGFSVNFHQAQADYIQTQHLSSNQFASNAAHPHNELLLWGVEGGLLPILAFGLLASFLCYRYLSLDWRKGLFFLGLLFPASFHSMTELPFYHAAIVFILFIFTTYLIEKSTFTEKAAVLPSWLNFKLSALLIPVIALCFMLSGLYTLNRLRHFDQSHNSEVHYLEQIINPVSIVEGIDYAWFILPLLNNKNDMESIEQFIREAEKRLSYWPRARLYQDLATAYQLIGKNALADQVKREGQRQFPFSTEFNNRPQTSLLPISSPASTATSLEQGNASD